jgi:tRNA(Ile)-lysidine synthase
VRYAFLERVAEGTGADRIATGHTADDQAETLLMRLLRGAGLAGLSGVPPKRGKIVRPLIETTRGEALAFLKEAGLPFVTDPSNDRPDFTRNRIRQEALPVLARFNPSVVGTLAAEAALIRDEDEALDAFVRPLLDDILAAADGQVKIDRDRFNGQLPGVRRRMLRSAVGLLGMSGADLSAVRTEEALGFMQHARTGRAMELLPGIELCRAYDAFLLRPRQAAQGFSVPLAVPGRTGLPVLSLSVETEVRDAAAAAADRASEGNYLWQAEFDYDTITGPLGVRSRRPGDRMRPAGMGGRSRKLQDIFTDLKVPRAERERIPLVVAGDDILWVPGIRLDGRFLPGPGTRRVLMVRVRKTEDSLS